MPIPCIAAEIRGQLKHSVIENTILQLSEPLLRLHLAENGEFVKDMASSAAELIARLTDDYDPANLIGRIAAFDEVSEIERSRLKRRIHKRYLQNFDPALRKKRLKAAWDGFAKALKKWIATTAPTEQVFSALRVRANELHKELDALPRGVWLG
jgi:hypothetical protein